VSATFHQGAVRFLPSETVLGTASDVAATTPGIGSDGSFRRGPHVGTESGNFLLALKCRENAAQKQPKAAPYPTDSGEEADLQKARRRLVAFTKNRGEPGIGVAALHGSL
jgi:hypothetical protein